MLNKIKLTNFRQHTDLELSFGAGMTAIRGGNENGKTTVIESIAYALFGTAALRDSLEDVVTWGSAVNSLKVELDFSVDGVAYNIKRSKASAELTYDGGIVTNQKEVTNYACRLLKVDAAAAARLTMSNQGAIRGALESGPKATTELIERLAEFDQIDHLIELMQEKLSAGIPHRDISTDLCDILGVDWRTGSLKSVTLELRAGEKPTVTVEHYVQLSGPNARLNVGRYALVESGPAAAA